jgi:APA family basic amino acid/polyamine antiporter
VSLFAKKSLAELHVESERGVLRRSLGPWNLTALGIGSIIGTGIFVFTGVAASQHAGPGLIVSMLIAATACAFAGLCYAELAAMIPVSGSAYTYAYATFGEVIAWIIGWDLILEYALSGATVAIGWSGYFVSFLRTIGIEFPQALAMAPGTVSMDGTVGIFNVPAALIILLVSGLLSLGIRESANTNTVLVMIKSMVLILFVVAGVSFINRDNLTPLIPPNTGEFGAFGWSGVLRGAAIMFFAYIGFDAVSTAAQEAKKPQRDLPLGILLSLAICTVLYIAVAIVLMGIVPYSRLNVPDPLAVGIDATGLTWLSPVIKTAALFGLFSTMLVQLLGQSRIFFSMSRDGLLPKMFSRVHPRFRTPHLSTMITGAVMAVAAGLLPLTTLGELVSMGTLLAFVLVCIGIIILRRTAPDLPRPFRTPWVPVVPILGALACFVQMLALPLTTWGRLLVWLALGMLVYFGYSARRSALRRPAEDVDQAA